MHAFRQGLRKFIREKHLFEPNQSHLVAVSGGLDSVVVLYCLADEGYRLGVAHVNYQLRGEESDHDQAFVQRLAGAFGLPVYCRAMDAEAYSLEHGVSIQMAARDLRYQWFRELVDTEGFDTIVTGHHLTDAIETVLLNLTRGTGIRGLHGILPKNDLLRRPLLFATRRSIEEYARAVGLRYREDASNDTDKYQRNIIRHQVLPPLRHINPSLGETFVGNFERFAFVERIFSRHVESVFNALARKEGAVYRFRIADLQELQGLRFFLHEWFAPKGFTDGQMYGVLRLLKSESGRYIESPTHFLEKDRDYLVLAPKVQYQQQAGLELLHLPERIAFGGKWEFCFSRIPIVEIPVHHDPRVSYVNWSEVRMPIRLRYWKQGDVFYPLGLGKRKKLSDFFVDLKIPRHRKNSIPLLVDNQGRIMWIAGYRMDHRFRIVDTTREALRVEVRDITKS
jgi:tRNA(Ile)-lysidine synthase